MFKKCEIRAKCNLFVMFRWKIAILLCGVGDRGDALGQNVALHGFLSKSSVRMARALHAIVEEAICAALTKKNAPIGCGFAFIL